jgi:hypothetical protein
VRAQLDKLAVEPLDMNLDQFGKLLRNDVEANLALVNAAHIPRQ